MTRDSKSVRLSKGSRFIRDARVALYLPPALLPQANTTFLGEPRELPSID
jgi:hypothetical protein